MSKYMLRNAEGYGVGLFVKDGAVSIEPKKAAETVVIPLEDVEKVIWKPEPAYVDVTIIHRGGKICLMGDLELGAAKLAEMLPGVPLEKAPKGRWEWLGEILLPLVVVAVPVIWRILLQDLVVERWGICLGLLLGLAVPLFFVRSRLRVRDVCYLGLIGFACSLGLLKRITVVDWMQAILPALMLTAVYGAVLLALVWKKRRFGRMLAILLIEALTFMPACAATINALLPARSVEQCAAVVEDVDYAFFRGRQVWLEGIKKPLSTRELEAELLTHSEFKYLRIVGGLGIEYIMPDSDALQAVEKENPVK